MKHVHVDCRLTERESCFKKSGNGSVTKVTGADWDNFEGRLYRYIYIIMYYIISTAGALVVVTV